MNKKIKLLFIISFLCLLCGCKPKTTANTTSQKNNYEVSSIVESANDYTEDNTSADKSNENETTSSSESEVTNTNTYADNWN